MSELQPPAYETPEQENPYTTQLRILGILLIIACSLAILGNAWGIFSVSFQIATGGPHPPAGMTPASRSGYQIGFYAPLVLGILAIPQLAFMIFSGIAMLRRRQFKVAYAGAILAVIPFSASCCCFLTIPLGVWGLVLLSNKQVKSLFS
ncbi:MAG: hypothetical protein ACTHN5_09390 [Phycisphaerae bacterium]